MITSATAKPMIGEPIMGMMTLSQTPCQSTAAGADGDERRRR